MATTLAVWEFPLKAAPRFAQNPSQSGNNQILPGGPAGGVTQGVSGGVMGGVSGGIAANVSTQGPAQGVQGGVNGGVGGAPIRRSSSSNATAPQTPKAASKIVIADLKFVGDVRDSDAVRARILKRVNGQEYDGSNSAWLDEFLEVGINADFQNHGYFEAVIDDPQAQPLDPEKHRMLVKVHVKEGDKFSAGAISIVSDDPAHALVIPEAELRRLMPLHTGDVFNAQEIRDGIEAMARFYGARGYADTTAVPLFSFDHRNRTIASTFQVHEGIQYHVASFHVRGLDSKTAQLMESRIQPGSVFDRGLLRELLNHGNAALGTNVSEGTAFQVKRNVANGTLDILLDFSGGDSGGVVQGVSGGATSEPVADGTILWPSTVKRGPMLLQVPGRGTLVQAEGSKDLVARVMVPESEAMDVQLNQEAEVDTRKGIVRGLVSRISPSHSNGTTEVDIRFITAVPEGVGAGLPVDGIIDIRILENILSAGRPVHGMPNSETTLFKVVDDGKEAVRVKVKIGHASVNWIEIVGGLNAGDTIILSDMSRYANVDRVQINPQIQISNK